MIGPEGGFSEEEQAQLAAMQEAAAPRPVELRTGSKARIVVAVVMRHGRTRRSPACAVAARISAMVSGRERAKLCFR